MLSQHADKLVIRVGLGQEAVHFGGGTAGGVVLGGIGSDGDDEADKHNTPPYQRRKTLFSSSENTMAFRCTVELVETPSNETTAAETRTTVAIFPCSPALFGPTNITTLAESSGLTFEGSLLPPEADDESGCKSPLITSLGDSDQSGGEAASVDPMIQLVRRGQCRFQTKIANGNRTSVANRDKNATIVVLDSVFVRVLAISREHEKRHAETRRTTEPLSIT